MYRAASHVATRRTLGGGVEDARFMGRRRGKGAVDQRKEGIILDQPLFSWGEGTRKRVFIQQVASSFYGAHMTDYFIDKITLQQG